jgi:hypothetical protein
MQVPGAVDNLPFNQMNGALCILQCLHVFWFYLILQAVAKKLGGGGIEDPREIQDRKKRA